MIYFTHATIITEGYRSKTLTNDSKCFHIYRLIDIYPYYFY